jgi:glycosyltransferase involved in cell wall biosynthesis
MCPSFDVSVVIPTYNRADWLPQTLASVLDQTLKPMEVIVVDDGSTDGTAALARSFPPSVKYFRIENSGVCRARNVGLGQATAPWIAFCDSDDLWRPDKLAAQARLVQEVPGLEYAFTNFRVVSNNVWSDDTKFDEAPPGYWDLPRRQVTPDAFVVDVSLYERLIGYQPIFPSTMIMSRNFAQRVGPWVDALGRTLSEDLEFILRCVDQPPIGVLSAPLVGIRKHAGGFSSQPLRTLKGEIEILHYVLAHHPAAAAHERVIRDSIVQRNVGGAELAFLLGHLGLVHDFLKAVPLSARSRSLRLKSLIASLPLGGAEPARKASLSLARLLRRVR